MAKRPSRYPEPKRRRLNIYAFDPLEGSAPGNKTTIDIPFEPLGPGPFGRVFKVVDYDASQKRYYEPVQLDRQEMLLNNGLDHSEFDPRFHQQMVYAVSSKVLETFEKALGRKVRFHGASGTLGPLRLFPHAFEDANAYFDPALSALLFGYFPAEGADVGRNLPGQTVFTCLSHDIIAHELTHAILHRQRQYFIEPTGYDSAAFHEGFADIVALFQRFTYRESLVAQLNAYRGDFSKGGFLGLASQFGQALGERHALREALTPSPKGPAVLSSAHECHNRGGILVAAVFDAFVKIYEKRVKDLNRIATNGSGILPAGDLHPDLINRFAGEAVKAADSLLRMCVRAIDYLPPVDVTFGDFLRAIATADQNLVSDDRLGQLDCVIEAFRARQIYPRHVASMSAEVLIWPTEMLPPLPEEIQHAFWRVGFFQSIAEAPGLSEEQRYNQLQLADAPDIVEGGPQNLSAAQREIATRLHNYAKANAKALGLASADKAPISVRGFHQTIRASPDGRWQPDTIVQFVQSVEDETLGGLKLRGGTTLIANAQGQVRHLIVKPLPIAIAADHAREGKERRDVVRDYVAYCDARDARMAWGDDGYRANRMMARARFSALHDGHSF